MICCVHRGETGAAMSNGKLCSQEFRLLVFLEMLLFDRLGLWSVKFSIMEDACAHVQASGQWWLTRCNVLIISFCIRVKRPRLFSKTIQPLITDRKTHVHSRSMIICRIISTT
jgi:hypothetical protein